MAIVFQVIAILIFCKRGYRAGTCVSMVVMVIYSGFITKGKHVGTVFIYGSGSIASMSIMLEGVAHWLASRSTRSRYIPVAINLMSFINVVLMGVYMAQQNSLNRNNESIASITK